MAKIPRKITPRRHEWSPYHTPRDAGSPSKAHKDQTVDANQLNSLTEAVIAHGKALKELQSHSLRSFEFFPFKIYSTPNAWLPFTSSADPSGYNPVNNWRTVSVRAGCVLNKYVDPLTSSLVGGTDLIRYPDTDKLAPPMTNQILVPESCSFYWIWIENLQAPVTQSKGSTVMTYYTIRHGTDPKAVNNTSYNNGPVGNPNPTWTTWPSSSGQNLILGYVDTLTGGSLFQSYIRQFIRTDVISAGGNYQTMSICIDGSPQLWYVDAFRSGSATP